MFILHQTCNIPAADRQIAFIKHLHLTVILPRRKIRQHRCHCHYVAKAVVIHQFHQYHLAVAVFWTIAIVLLQRHDPSWKRFPTEPSRLNLHYYAIHHLVIPHSHWHRHHHLHSVASQSCTRDTSMIVPSTIFRYNHDEIRVHMAIRPKHRQEHIHPNKWNKFPENHGDGLLPPLLLEISIHVP